MRLLINVQQLSEALNVPLSWIYQRTSQGQKGIPHVKMGKYVRFDLEEVMTFLREANKN